MTEKNACHYYQVNDKRDNKKKVTATVYILSYDVPFNKGMLRFIPSTISTNYNMKFLRKEDRDRRLYGALLQEYCFQELKIGKNATIYHSPKGKPYINGSKYFISKSYTSDAVSISIHESNIGLDIEKNQDTVDFSPAQCFMHPVEHLHFRSLTDSKERTRFFFECWVKKEAILKYLGTGFLTDPTKIRNDNYQTQSITVSEKYHISCCTQNTATIVVKKINITDLTKSLEESETGLD